MADVLDLSKKLRERLLIPSEEDFKSYEVRSTLCEKSMMDKGFCDCKICTAKHQLILKVVELIRKDLHELSVNEKTPMYYADVLEVLYSTVNVVLDRLNDNTK